MAVARAVPGSPFRELRRAVAADEIVRALAEFGYTQRQIAHAAGATDRSVRNWATTGAIRPAYNERIRELFEISLLLSDSLTGRGVTQWVSAKNVLLDNKRPIDMIAKDQSDEVRDAVDAYLDGSYV